jgi:hypothetical protein
MNVLANVFFVKIFSVNKIDFSENTGYYKKEYQR